MEPFINKVWQVYSNNRGELAMFMCNLCMSFFLGLIFGVQKLCTCPCDPSLLCIIEKELTVFVGSLGCVGTCLMCKYVSVFVFVIVV